MSYEQGTHAAHQQYFSYGYQLQQPPWQSSDQHDVASYSQQPTQATSHTNQYTAFPPEQTQQPSRNEVPEQPAWYGYQHSAYPGQAVGYTGAQAGQPPQYGYNPEEVANVVPQQQYYGYNAAQPTQQHIWQAPQAQQPQQPQHLQNTQQPQQLQPTQQPQQPQQPEQTPALHYQQQQHPQHPWTTQDAHQQSYQQQYQYQYSYTAPQAYSPYGYSHPYQLQPQSQPQQYGSTSNQPVHDASKNEMNMPQTPDAMQRSQHDTDTAPPLPQAPAQAPAPPVVAHAPPPAPTVVDVASLLFQPHRTSRPHAIVVIVRGIPGSGKSWLAQRLRALEIENGGKAPRILSIDPYFMVDDDGGDRRSANSTGEKYEYDAAKEASYEHALVKKLAHALCDTQHRFVIVDAPLLLAAGVQSFCAVAKAAKYEVFVTQPPDQDPQTCFERNVHDRTAQDVLEASRSLEPSPPAIPQLYCAAIIPSSTHETDSVNPPLPPDAEPVDDSRCSTDTKRKSIDVPRSGGTGEKRIRTGDASAASMTDDSAVLAMVDAGFSQQGAGETSKGARKHKKSVNRSRWSDDDDSEEEGASQCQVRSAQNGQQQLGGAAGTPSGIDSRIQQLLTVKRDKVRKSVRWPDQLGEEEDGAFLIGKPQQLETVHIIPGLGPGEPQPMDTSGGTSFSSFADAVRAEHQYEKQKLHRSRGL